jgi:hypothetical protein
MPIIPLECPSCGANLTINSDDSAAICDHCGKPFVVKDAIVNNYIKNVININVGTVNMSARQDFEIVGGTLKKYMGESTEVVIPDNVKIIGRDAFNQCKAITAVKIPDSVVEIECWAFAGCTNLKIVNLPETIQIVDRSAFSGCCKLEIAWPDSWKKKQLSKLRIASTAIENCTFDFHNIVVPQKSNISYLCVNYAFQTREYGFLDFDSYLKGDWDDVSEKASYGGMFNELQQKCADMTSLFSKAGIDTSQVSVVTVPIFIRKEKLTGGFVTKQRGTAQAVQISFIPN